MYVIAKSVRVRKSSQPNVSSRMLLELILSLSVCRTELYSSLESYRSDGETVDKCLIFRSLPAGHLRSQHQERRARGRNRVSERSPRGRGMDTNTKTRHLLCVCQWHVDPVIMSCVGISGGLEIVPSLTACCSGRREAAGNPVSHCNFGVKTDRVLAVCRPPAASASVLQRARRTYACDIFWGMDSHITAKSFRIITPKSCRIVSFGVELCPVI